MEPMKSRGQIRRMALIGLPTSTLLDTHCILNMGHLCIGSPMKQCQERGCRSMGHCKSSLGGVRPPQQRAVWQELRACGAQAAVSPKRL